MKYKTIALFCAVTIAAFAVVNTGFAKHDPSPPGATQVISSNVNYEIPFNFVAIDTPAVPGAEFVFAAYAFRGNPILLASESPKSRPPNQKSLNGYDFATSKDSTGDAEWLRPDH